MSWRDRLQPGSFRDVTFHTEQASGRGGRRVVVHEYPLQEEHDTEDLGRSAGSQRVRIFLVGEDYDLQRDKLIDALEKPGPGTLVHPFRGTQRVQILNYDWTITTRRGGYCAFNIELVTAGERKYPIADSANANALKSACNGAAIALQEGFTQQFSVDDQPAFVEQAAVDQLTAAVDSLRALNGQIGTLLQPVSDTTNQLDLLSGEISNLVLQPRNLASTMIDVIATTIGGVNEIATAFKGYNSMLGLGSDAIPATTPSRKRQATNQAATDNLLLGTVTVETARFIAGSSAPFTTYNEAMTSRDTLLEQIDSLIESGTDTEYYALVELQSALIRRVNDVAPGLQKINYVQLQRPLPALALAHQLYGDATRADELTKRNAVAHPGFMPTGTDLEVLS